MHLEPVIAAVVVGFAVLQVVLALLETQRVRDFIPAPAADSTSDSPYFRALNEAAKRLGFIEAGVFVQARGSRVYRARLALWVSPDGTMLLRIAGGRTAGVPIRRSTLTSFEEPGRVLETSDDFGMADLSGLADQRVVLNAGPDELLAAHQERLRRCAGPLREFTAAGAHIAYEAMLAMKAARMVELGLGRFTDRDRTAWRHTWKGAWRNYSKGFLSQWSSGKAQRHRASLKRPGDK